MTIDEKIARSEYFVKLCEQNGMHEWKEEHEQLAAWLRELVERRKEPEIITCGECELKLVCCRTIRSEGRRADDFCSYAERRTE